MEWLREKQTVAADEAKDEKKKRAPAAVAADEAQEEKKKVAPPANFAEICKELLAYFEKAPSGT